MPNKHYNTNSSQLHSIAIPSPIYLSYTSSLEVGMARMDYYLSTLPFTAMQSSKISLISWHTVVVPHCYMHADL